MTTAERYVTAAYCVIFALVLLYVVIISLKLQRLEREVAALAPQQSEVEREVAPSALPQGETATHG
jgi:CcmD family protein